jgi:hypothetical protein
MKSHWYPLIALMILAVMVACQAVAGGLPVADNHGAEASSSGTVMVLNITQPQDESVVRSNPVTVSGNVTSGVDVMVNGQPVNVEGGRFSVAVEMEEGPNSIEVVAVDGTGRQVTKYVGVVFVP